MIVKKIRINNFKSIYDELEIDFETVNGFWRINGPVGAGKTTIGEAIIYSLFGDVRGKNNNDLISWGEKHSTVEVWCNTKGHDLYIKREINLRQQSPIYAEVDGKELVFTNKRNAQKQLEDEYYDISRITLELLCIISFNNFKSLATLNTTDTKQFLDQVFGFYILTNYTDICKDERNKLKSSLYTSQSNINSIQSQINKIVQLSQIAKIEGDIKETKDNITSLKSSIRDYKEQLTKHAISYREEVGVLNNKLGEIKALGQNKAKEIKFIEQGVCPTCGAPIDQSQLEIKKKEKDLLLEQYTEIDNKVKDIYSKYNESKLNVNKLIDDASTELNSAVSLLSKLEEQEKRLNINTKEVDDLKDKLKEENDNYNALVKDDNEWDRLQDILSVEIRQKILKSFVPLLNKSIREYTVQFQVPYIIEFDDTFSCHIGLYGVEQNIPISSLSTGQLKVVDISIILGVLKTIMTGAKFNVCFLDELISNMDGDLRQTICKVLSHNLQEQQTLFIISHTELNDEYFDGSIDCKLLMKDSVHQKSSYSINHLKRSTYNDQ